jgi:hypothetical protein
MNEGMEIKNRLRERRFHAGFGFAVSDEALIEDVEPIDEA